MLSAYDSQLRPWNPSTPPPGMQFTRIGAIMRVTGLHRGFIDTERDVIHRGAELDRVIEEHRDYFAARGESVEWKTRTHDLPADLPARLRAAGFRPEDPETVLVAEAARLAIEPNLDAAVTLRVVSDARDLTAIAALETEVLGEDMSWIEADLAGRIESGEAAGLAPVVVMVAEAEGVVVSAAWIEFWDGSDFAGLWGGSTLESWRGRGIYSALVARRAMLAHARGIRYLQVDSSSDSGPILRRRGFRPITTTVPYVWTPAGK